MAVNVLVVEPVSTSRIVLKVKLTAAAYDVTVATTPAEARAALRGRGTLAPAHAPIAPPMTAPAAAPGAGLADGGTARDAAGPGGFGAESSAAPDLVIVGSGLGVAAQTGLIAELRASDRATNLPIVALVESPALEPRLRLLAAGADEVFAGPLNDMLFQARLRSLVRARDAAADLALGEATRRALGLAEAAPSFERPPVFGVLGRSRLEVARAAELVRRAMPAARLTTETGARPAPLSPEAAAVDVFILVAAPDCDAGALARIADLRARRALCRAEILVLLPEPDPTLCANALDLGASDVLGGSIDCGELGLRLARLARRKRSIDQLRDGLSSGLAAALTDPLTGLYNRRFAMPQLARMARNASEQGRRIAVMLVDLDHFKRVNDTLGHAAGDRVLAETARRLQASLGAEDLLARIGGEEFLVCLPDMTADCARRHGRKLCEAVNGTPFTVARRHPELHLTASIGIALSAPGKTGDRARIEALVAEADRALYLAKLEGRNRVELARPAA